MVENELEFLFAGFAVFWAALFVYLVLLQIRLRGLQQEVETLEERLAEYEGGSRATSPAGRATSTGQDPESGEVGSGPSTTAEA